MVRPFTLGRDAREAGGALAVAVTFIAVLLVLAGTLLGLDLVRSHTSAERIRLDDAQRACEAGLAAAVTRIHQTDTPPATLAGILQNGYGRGIAWALNIRRNGTLYKVSVAAGSADVHRVMQAIVERTAPPPPTPRGLRGAVTSYYGLEMHADLQVNGNNFDMSRSTLAGDPDATYGISTNDRSEMILNNGLLSGNNYGPTADNATAISQGILNVNDNDDFPNSPGRALEMTDEDLVAAAVAGGTYFTSEKQFAAWVGLLKGTYAPDTSPIYLAFRSRSGSSPLNDLAFDPAKAYILINHVTKTGKEPEAGGPPEGIAETGNVHVDMNGILIFDDPKHVNGGSVVNGAVISLWGTPGVQEKFGQGGATMQFSTEAIAAALQNGLGRTGGPLGARLLVLRENPPSDAEAYAALAACGVDTSAMSAADASLSAGWSAP